MTAYARTVTHGKIGDNGTARRANAEPPLTTTLDETEEVACGHAATAQP